MRRCSGGARPDANWSILRGPADARVPENQGVSAAWMPGLSVARREWMARHLRHSVPRGKIFYLDSL